MPLYVTEVQILLMINDISDMLFSVDIHEYAGANYYLPAADIIYRVAQKKRTIQTVKESGLFCATLYNRCNRAFCVDSEAEVKLQSLSSSSDHGSYTVFIVPKDCKIVSSSSAVVGTLRSAFVSYNQGAILLNCVEYVCVCAENF